MLALVTWSDRTTELRVATTPFDKKIAIRAIPLLSVLLFLLVGFL
jgi:hypothetical protein